MKVVLLAEAEAELTEAVAWYDEKRAGLGDELVRAVQDALDVIAEVPSVWPRWPGTSGRIPAIRRFLLPGFPYAIAYQARADRISVLAITHGKRMPLHWISRAP